MENMKAKFKKLMDLFVDQSLDAGNSEKDVAEELQSCGFTKYDLETLDHADIADAYEE